MQEFDVIIVIGANLTENHPSPPPSSQAAKRGAKLVVMDLRGQALKRHAWQMMQFKNGTDVAMLNALLNVIVGESSTISSTFRPTPVFDKLAESVKPFTPEEMSPICGIEPDVLRMVARTSRAPKVRSSLGYGRIAAYPWHRQRALPDRAVADLRSAAPAPGCIRCVARTTCRARPMGPDPDVLSDGKSVENAEIRAKYEAAWGVTLDPKRGKTVVEIMDAVHADEIKGMYIMGENPAMSDPDLNHARRAGASRASVVQDIFLTETASYADVVLPASAWPEKDGTVTNTNRQVQMAAGSCCCRARRGRICGSSRSRSTHRLQLELPACQ